MRKNLIVLMSLALLSGACSPKVATRNQQNYTPLNNNNNLYN
jgi:hypothetical protein